MAFFGLSHVDVPVRDLERARAFYCGCLGFHEGRRGEGWLDLETGTARLRLVETASPERRAALRIQSSEVEADLEHLTGAGASLLYEASRTAELELAGSVRDPDGNTITVWRELSEDEYGFLPELPKQGRWLPDAEGLLKSLLTRVPALFRGLARRKVARNAEYLAEGRPVTRDDVVRAFIVSNAKITRDRVRQPLIDHGFDPADYPEEFES